MFKRLTGTLRKLIPTIVLIALAIVAGATDVFSTHVHDVVSRMFQEYASKLLPFSINALIGAIILNLAYLFYQPLREGVGRALKSGQASERGRGLIMQGLMFVYWGGAIFIAATIIAPDIVSKVFLGSTFLVAAVAFAMQGAANDLVCGIMMQFSPRFKIDDPIQVVGMEVKGRVKNIDFFSTEVEASDGTIRVPNREIWAKAVKVVKPEEPKSPIILPPGVELKK